MSDPDLDALLAYLARTYLPAEIKCVYDRLREREAARDHALRDELTATRAEVARWKARCTSDAAYF